jgi:hypothetical protein
VLSPPFGSASARPASFVWRRSEMDPAPRTPWGRVFFYRPVRRLDVSLAGGATQPPLRSTPPDRCLSRACGKRSITPPRRRDCAKSASASQRVRGRKENCRGRQETGAHRRAVKRNHMLSRKPSPGRKLLRRREAPKGHPSSCGRGPMIGRSLRVLGGSAPKEPPDADASECAPDQLVPRPACDSLRISRGDCLHVAEDPC